LKVNENEVVKAYLKALEGRNLEAVLALFSPDAIVHSPMYGKVPARDFYKEFFADSTKNQITFLGLLGRGEGAKGQVVTGYWASIDWVLPTGAHIPFEVAGLMELDDQGRIEAFHIITDTAFIRPIFERDTGRATARPDWVTT
jgi:hypothetical protein